MKERTDASKWLYERAKWNGAEVWGTGAALDHNSVPDGLYWYDLYGTGEPEDFAHNFISKQPVTENCAGAVLSACPLPFEDEKSMRLENLCFFDEEPMLTLDEIVQEVQMAEKQELQAGFQMQGF